MPHGIVYPVCIYIHDVSAALYNRTALDVDHRNDFERNCVYLSKGVLDYDFLTRSYQRSDNMLMLYGYVYELVGADGQQHTLERTRVLLGFATMYRQRYTEFLHDNKRVAHLHILSNPINMSLCMYVMHIHAMATRYFLGKEMLRIIEHMSQINHCSMMVVRTVPSSFLFYVKHGFARSNDWLMLSPLNDQCPWLYIHTPKHPISVPASISVVFDGDGHEQGFLLTKYIGKNAASIRDGLHQLQQGGRCCLKFLK